MDIDGIPLFSMLKSKMGYLNQRQQVIAQNVANSSTPGFTPKDLKPFTLASSPAASKMVTLAPVAQTQAGHLAGLTSMGSDLPGAASADAYKPVDAPDNETKLDGNRVVLEEQMIKMNQTRVDFDTASSIYQKAMSFLTLAAKEPGK